jgi:hypothetical protein
LIEAIQQTVGGVSKSFGKRPHLCRRTEFWPLQQMFEPRQPKISCDRLELSAHAVVAIGAERFMVAIEQHPQRRAAHNPMAAGQMSSNSVLAAPTTDCPLAPTGDSRRFFGRNSFRPIKGD